MLDKSYRDCAAKPSPLLKDLPELSTPGEVAAVLRCSERYVQKECRAGKLQSRFVAGRYLIQQSDVEIYLEANKICQNVTLVPRLNGGQTVVSGKSLNISAENAAAAQRVQQTVSKLLKSSRATS